MSKANPYGTTTPEAEFAEAFGTACFNARIRMRWTQREVALRAGLSVSFLSDVENGKRAASLLSAAKIAAALGIGLAKLIPTWRNPA